MSRVGMIVGIVIGTIWMASCERMIQTVIGERAASPGGVQSAGAPSAGRPSAITGLQSVTRLTEERVQESDVVAVAPTSKPRGERGGAEPEGRGFLDVHFGYDSWRVSEAGGLEVIRNAEWVKANPGRRVRIEGHCDERGTQAYDVVLGEKRANAVRSYLIELGVAPERLEVVSYGRERPLCREASEACWRQNRRVHLGWQDAEP